MSLVKPQVSITQVVMLLLISRAGVSLNYVPMFAPKLGLTATLIGNIIGMFIGLIMIIPMIIFQKNHNNQHIINVAIDKNKVFGTVIGFVYLTVILLNTVGSIFSFEFFITNAIYPNSSIVFIILSIVICCFICAKNGIEGIARTGFLLFFLLLFGILFIIFVSTKSIDLLNIKPILDESAKQILYATIFTVSKYVELIMLILLLPNIKNSPIKNNSEKTKGKTSSFKKASILYLIGATLFVEVTCFYLSSVLGEYAYSQTYPYYTLASIVETNLLQRLDSIHMVLWVFISFIKITTLIVLANTCIRSIFPKVNKATSLSIIFIIVTSLSLAIGFHPEWLNQLNVTGLFVTITLTSIVPLLLSKKTKSKGDPIVKENIIIDNTAT